MIKTMAKLHRLWRPPHLHRNHPEVEARETWLELFYDLVYVAVLIQLGNVLSDDVSWRGAGRFAVLFIPVWWAWSNYTFYMNRFIIDDVWHRLLVIIQIFCVAWIGASVGGAFGLESTQFVLLYISLRVTIILLYLRTFPHVAETQAMATRYITDYHLVAICLWGASLLLEPEGRWLIWLGAFAWELFNSQRPVFRRFHRQHPLNGEHMRERFGTFILLVLGESFIKSVTLDRSLSLTPLAFIFSAPGIVVLFSLWWLYFEDTNDAYQLNDEKTANPTLWLYTHLPLSMALVGFGVATKKLLEAVYESVLSPQYAFLYCGTLAVYCLALIILNLWGEKLARGQRAAARGLGLVITGGSFYLLRGQGPVWFTVTAGAVFGGMVAFDLYLAKRYPESDPEIGELMA